MTPAVRVFFDSLLLQIAQMRAEIEDFKKVNLGEPGVVESGDTELDYLNQTLWCSWRENLRDAISCYSFRHAVHRVHHFRVGDGNLESVSSRVVCSGRPSHGKYSCQSLGFAARALLCWLSGDFRVLLSSQIDRRVWNQSTLSAWML